MKDLIEYLKKSIIFLGHFGEMRKPIPIATAFLISVNTVLFLVTAKHVVLDPKSKEVKDRELYAMYNVKTPGKPYWRDLGGFRTAHKFDWIFHRDVDVDIAMLPFPLEPEIDTMVIPDTIFEAKSNLLELDDVFFLSYQPGTALDGVSPVFRSGIVSRINSNNTFLIDAAAFPGNSGSPVFAKPTVIELPNKLGMQVSGGKFVGIIGSYIPYQEVARSDQTGQARVIFEENTGLSLVWGADYIREIQGSEVFKQQLIKIEDEEREEKERELRRRKT